jgi:tRNA modification GTPase
LQKLLVKAAQLPEIQPGDVVVNNIRHMKHYRMLLKAIQRVKEGIENEIFG